ncbi:MAG TPA: transcription antitermination factor NusB [Desulfobulbus sp.]|nr:transcription antitermination factor NusB [Desulfobulbus sp.]
MGLRRKSRELALQFLYGHDFQGRSSDEQAVIAELDEFVASFDSGEKALPYARQVILGLCAHLPELDRLLATHAKNWRLERMTVVDRNVLRIAAYEMLYSDDVPAQVAINEALEVAKRYSTSDAVAFINGILDALQSESSDE